MKLLKSILFTAVFALGTSIYAQEEATTEEQPSFAISGSIDTYFRSSEYAPELRLATYRFCTRNGQCCFLIEGEKSGFVADLVVGPRGADAVFNSTGSSNIVNQLYAYYNVSDNFTLTLGNFNTFLGYEVISPVANFNYTTSYMFSYGPFSHTGIKADFSLSDNVSLMLGLLNSTDMTESQPIGEDFMIGAQLGLFGQYINYLGGGNAGVSQIDFTGGLDLTESLYLGLNATSYSDDSDVEFSGVALYPQYAFSDAFALGARFEAFSENGLAAIDADGGEADNTSFTLTGSFTEGNLIIKPEIRIDSASGQFYTNADGSTDGLSTFILAAIYSF